MDTVSENTDTPAPFSQPKNKSRQPFVKYILYGVVEVLIAFSILFVLNYFNILPLSNLFPNQFNWLPHAQTGAREESTQTTSPPTLQQPTASYPISLQSSFVYSAVTYYELRNVPVKDIRNEGDQLGLTIEDPNAASIVFPISKDTVITKGQVNEAGIPAAQQDIKANSKINIVASFDAKKNLWNVRNIYIYPEPSQSNTTIPTSMPK